MPFSYIRGWVRMLEWRRDYRTKRGEFRPRSLTKQLRELAGLLDQLRTLSRGQDGG